YSELMYFTGVNVDPKAGRDFIRAFRAKEGHPPSYQAGQLYDSIRMYAWAIAKGGYAGEGIRTALLSLAGQVPSVFGGGITMGSDHYTIGPAVALWQVRSGNEVKVPLPAS